MHTLCEIHTASLTSRSWNEPNVDMPDLPAATTPGKQRNWNAPNPWMGHPGRAESQVTQGKNSPTSPSVVLISTRDPAYTT